MLEINENKPWTVLGGAHNLAEETGKYVINYIKGMLNQA